MQLPSLSSGVAHCLPQSPHFSQLSTFGLDPTFNFRPPPPSDRQEDQLSAQRGLPVIRGGDAFMQQLPLQVPLSQARLDL